MKSRIILILAGLSLSLTALAENNYFRFVNNFNVAMKLTIHPIVANVKNTCGGDIQNIDVSPQSKSCEFEFSTVRIAENETLENSGLITISKKDDPDSACIYQYQISYKPSSSYAAKHSENISLQSCKGNLKSTEISLINNYNQTLPRPLINTLMSSEYKDKAEKFTESIALADCGGKKVDNCLIASPDLNKTYLKNGSTLAQAILLQLELDRYEPLNFAQFIGSHNSAISHHYTKSTMEYNLSHSDPDHYLTLTEQLKSGIRLLELDVQWHNNTVALCHDDIARDPDGMFCEDNYPLSAAITEIKSWIKMNPDTFLFIYFDVHAPLADHVKDLDNLLENLEPYIFTPQMATQYYGVKDNYLPAYRLSQDDLIQRYKKNIIITNDDDTNNLKNSSYVFVNVQNSPSAPLPEYGVDSILSSEASFCDDSSKYDNINKLFNIEDPEHYNLLRLNEGRTVVNYVESIGQLDPEQYINYLTTDNLPKLLHCPINIFSTSMLGYTCAENNCDHLSTDPKLYSFLWSWDLGYPLRNGGSSISYINTATGHFQNKSLASNNSYTVLCYRQTTAQKTPAALQWYVEGLKINNTNNVFDAAQAVCKKSGGNFAVPTTSYWMSDVINMLKAKNITTQYVLVNYQYINGKWIPNVNPAKGDDDHTLKGRSLVE